jgi:hypothetical protein
MGDGDSALGRMSKQSNRWAKGFGNAAFDWTFFRASRSKEKRSKWQMSRGASSQGASRAAGGGQNAEQNGRAEQGADCRTAD